MDTITAVLEAVKAHEEFHEAYLRGEGNRTDVTWAGMKEAVKVWRKEGYPMPSPEMLNPLMFVAGGEVKVIECERCAAYDKLAELYEETQATMKRFEGLNPADLYRIGPDPKSGTAVLVSREAMRGVGNERAKHHRDLQQPPPRGPMAPPIPGPDVPMTATVDGVEMHPPTGKPPPSSGPTK